MSEHALGWIEPSYIHLGCISCTRKEAKDEKCISGYHLCTSLEVYTGAYYLARLQG